MKIENDYSPVKGTYRLKNYVMRKIMKENFCLVMGSKELIDKFSDDCNIDIDIVMTDILTFDNQVESVPLKIFDRRSKDIMICGLAKKDSLINIVTQGNPENMQEVNDLVSLELRKEVYNDGYIFNADSICARTEEDKVRMINSLFRIPDKETKQQIEIVSQDKAVLEIDRYFDQIAKQLPHGDPETFLESLGISESRADELQTILITNIDNSIGRKKLSGVEELNDMNHEVFLDLLEKEENVSITEKLYLSFSQGVIMEKFSTMMKEKFFHLDEDKDERIKNIGKAHSCELRKSDTIYKIENLEGMNIREKMKACLWAGIYNERFYGEEKSPSLRHEQDMSKTTFN